ncbi:MAG: hypothetical protein HY983_04375 [Candidatus Magasanikbacteria bacterium]|nr:hypothetical protein [Candidatus Magasanikbacteria bacterium]
MLFPLILLAYFIFTGFLAEPLPTGSFNFQKTWRTAILGMFFSFSLASFLAGAAVVFFKLNLPAIIAILIVNFLITLVLRLLIKKDEVIVIEGDETETELEPPTAAWWGAILYLVLAGYGFYLLHTSQSAVSLLTPWQTIDPLYIYIFASATLLVGALVFSKLPVSFILGLLIIHGALLHSYLPLTHQLFYGADQWRHVAVETRIVAERPLEAARLSAPANTLEGKLAINSSGLNVSTLAYSSFWGVSALIARVTSVDLIALNKWLVPILWSLILPIILFELGSVLGWSDRASLFLVWLSALPFTWQALGSLTLPVSFGFLIWLLSVILLLKRIGQPEHRQWPFLLVFGVLSIFNYTLYFILFWLGWALAEAITKFDVRRSMFKIFSTGLLALLTALVLPAVELITHYSQFTPPGNWFHQLRQVVYVKQFLANLSAWYLAIGPRAGDITTGNIIFNQTPLAAFVPNALTLWRWWLVAFMALFLVAVAYGFILCLKKQSREYQWLAALGGSLFLSYFISRYLLAGENIFTRRLDPVLAFFFLFFVLAAFTVLNFFSLKKRFVAPVVLLLTFAIAASYSLGPDTSTVNASEYAAMQYVWSQEKNSSRHCVIAGAYPLLALEALSGKDIIGGGFSINQYFSQPELVSLYRNFSGSDSDWQEALRLTSVKRCTYVGAISRFGIAPEKQFGNIGVWWYPK